MTPETILQTAESAGARFHLAGGSLRFEQPTDRPLPAALVQSINRHKPELVRLIQEGNQNRPGPLPDEMRETMKGRRLYQAFEALKQVDRLAVDAAAALHYWTGVDPSQGGAQDMMDSLWAKVQRDPDRLRPTFESLRDSSFAALVDGWEDVTPTTKALCWLWSVVQAAREIGQDLGLIQPRGGDQLREGFRKFKIAFHQTK